MTLLKISTGERQTNWLLTYPGLGFENRATMKQVQVVRAVHEPGVPVPCPVVHSFCNLVPRAFSFVKKGKGPGNEVDSSFYRIVHPNKAFCH